MTKKGIYKFVGSRRKTKENVDPLLNVEGSPAMDVAEKAEVSNVLFLPQFSQIRLVVR